MEGAFSAVYRYNTYSVYLWDAKREAFIDGIVQCYDGDVTHNATLVAQPRTLGLARRLLLLGQSVFRVLLEGNFLSSSSPRCRWADFFLDSLFARI